MLKRRSVCITMMGLALCLCGGGLVRAEEQQLTCSMGREYFLYLPDDLDAEKTYWLVVGVHGHGGKGKNAAGLAKWVGKGNCIVVGPSFPSGYYQTLSKGSDTQLIGIFKFLRARYKLYPRMFLYGFSGGAQFAHRFAMAHPELTIGCAAHSGGTWADTVNPKARNVPIAISCGEKDTSKSTSNCPMGRCEWAKTFAGNLHRGGFYFKARFWPGVGHRASPGARQMTEDCFCLATTGMHDDQLQPVLKEVAAVAQLADGAQYAEALARVRQLPQMKPPVDAQPPKTPEGNLLPGLSEDAYGWHEVRQGKVALETVRAWYLKQQAAGWTARIEKAGLEKVAAIEKALPADAVEQLAALKEQFKGQKNVLSALARALVKARRAQAGR